MPGLLVLRDRRDGATDAPGNSYNVLQYQRPNLYGNFGSQRVDLETGPDPPNQFQRPPPDPGFGDGIVVGPDAPRAGRVGGPIIPLDAGTFGGSRASDVPASPIRAQADRSERDGSRFCRDGAGAGSTLRSRAAAPMLGALQDRHIDGANTIWAGAGLDRCGDARYIVAGRQDGYDDIVAFGGRRGYRGDGPEPERITARPFGQLYLAMAISGRTRAGRSMETPRLIGASPATHPRPSSARTTHFCGGRLARQQRQSAIQGRHQQDDRPISGGREWSGSAEQTLARSHRRRQGRNRRPRRPDLSAPQYPGLVPY